jgi:hypothetical protein
MSEKRKVQLRTLKLSSNRANHLFLFKYMGLKFHLGHGSVLCTNAVHDHRARAPSLHRKRRADL